MAITENTPELTAEQARALLRYEPDTGRLFWRERARDTCHSENSWLRWNTLYSGAEAFTSIDGNGYKHGRVLGSKHKAHRIIWLMQTGRFPEEQIDHINGVRADNRLENLRAVTNAENQKNKSLQRDNSSGSNGVSWSKTRNRWMAYININGRMKNLGRFKTIEEAIQARSEASKLHGYSLSHGRPSQV